MLMNEYKSCDSWILKREHCLGIQLLAKTTRLACSLLGISSVSGHGSV